MQFLLYTDNLASLRIKEVCEGAKRAGFNGLDLTLRTGGHVLPANAEVGLAEAKKIADAEGVTIPMVTTEVIDTDSPHAEAIFAAAAHYGARHIKLGYYPYQPFGTAAKQYDEARPKLERLARLGEKYKVLPCLHTHSGRLLANSGPTLYMLLKNFRPGEIGADVDPSHMTIEGGVGGWEIGLDLVAPWLGIVAIKNYQWKLIGKGAKGVQKYRPVFVPLADGVAPLPEFMACIRQLKYDGIVSFGSEYALKPKELLDQSAKDLIYLKSIMK